MNMNFHKNINNSSEHVTIFMSLSCIYQNLVIIVQYVTQLNAIKQNCNFAY